MIRTPGPVAHQVLYNDLGLDGPSPALVANYSGEWGNDRIGDVPNLFVWLTDSVCL